MRVVLPIAATTREEVLCTIRQVFGSGPRDRETALRDVAQAMGYARLGANIRKTLESDLLTAVKRGILENDGGELRLFARNLGDYHRDDLKASFLSAIGRGWVERDEAVRLLARWLGFARTGSEMKLVGKSLMNGLVREGELETEGKEMIRRA